MPQRPETLPKSEEARAIEGPFGNVALEAAFPRAAVRPAATESAPIASASREGSERRQQRLNLAEQEPAHDRARPPPKPLPEPSPSEPGVELRRLRSNSRPREIDETDPYVR
jgi:hypothetical protein